MKWSLRYVERAPLVDVGLPDGVRFRIPLIIGIRKHPNQDRLATLLH